PADHHRCRHAGLDSARAGFAGGLFLWRPQEAAVRFLPGRGWLRRAAAHRGSCLKIFLNRFAASDVEGLMSLDAGGRFGVPLGWSRPDSKRWWHSSSYRLTPERELITPER